MSRLLVATILASGFGPPFLFSGVAVALPTLGRELDASAVELGLVETVYLAGSLAFLLPAGRLADATDKNALYKAGLAAFALTSLLIALTSWMPGLLVLRFVQGAAGALYGTTSIAILAELVGPGRRGRVFGMTLGVAYAGLTLGPILAGILVESIGWRSVFVAGAAVTWLGWAGTLGRLPSRWRSPGDAVHVGSTILVVVATLALVAGSATMQTPVVGLAFVGVGIAIGAVFVRSQRRLPRPLVDVAALVQNAPLRSALLVQMLLYMNAFCSTFLLSLYLQVVRDRSASDAGEILAVGSVVMAALAPFAGAFGDRIGAARVAAAGVVMVTVAAALGTQLGTTTPTAVVLVQTTLQGLGFALFSSPNMARIMDSVPAAQVGMASALGAKSRSLGMVTGMLTTAALVAVHVGSARVEERPDELLDVVRVAFVVLSCAGVAAFVAGALGGRGGGRGGGDASAR